MIRRFALIRLFRLVSLLMLLMGVGRLAQANIYTVVSADDEGPGTLRQAILDANAHPGSDMIIFNIEPGGPQTIQPLSPLPPVSGTTQIFGNTQPGFAGTPVIELDGSLLPVSDGDGLILAAPNCQLLELTINRFGGAGIHVVPPGSGTQPVNGTQIANCFIGTDVGGTEPLGNTYGVVLDGASNVTLGGNVISANGTGISLTNNAHGNALVSNRIGVDFSGGAALSNLLGITIEGGGGNQLSSNIVCANYLEGVVLRNTTSNILSGNMLGVNVFYAPMGNGLEGLALEDSRSNSLKNNVIATNTASGILLTGIATTGNLIQSNTILANAYGVEIRGGSANNTVGGSTAALGNEISGNIADGVTIYESGSGGNTLQHNLLHGNGQFGVSTYASGNSVLNNTIDANSLEGVFVGLGDDGAYADHIAILSNSIFNNGDLGIFLDTDGITGGNDLQPAPDLSTAVASSTTTFIIGSLQAAPNTTYRLEFFDNQENDASGLGEGETYLGAMNVNTDAGGTGGFYIQLPPVSLGHYLSATATDPANNTSGFSVSLLVGDANPGPTLTDISPANAPRNSAAFKLTLNGADFVPGAVVRWNGFDRATTFVSSTQVTAIIPETDLAGAGAFPVSVYNPAPGGGESNSLNFTVNNPAPALTALNPASVLVGSGQFTLTVTGTNFVPESTIRWNGANRTTTFVSSTTLTTLISATDVATAGTADVTVSTPGPGGGLSSALTFQIQNPVPALTSLSPGSATAGGSSFLMTLNGANFLGASQVQWNGSPRPTSYLSPTQLQITVPKTDIATAGTASVTVATPGPGGGLSNALPFTVNGIPQLSISAAVATRSGAVTVAFTLKNIGTDTAAACKLTVAKLDTTGTSTTLPLSIGDLGVGAASGTLRVTFPASVTAGSHVFTITVAAGGKSLSASKQIAVP